MPNIGYAVVVGRFQTPDLHAGHYEFISEVSQRHEHLIIFIGVHVTQPTKRNPLDFMTRKFMLQQAFPKAIIFPIKDRRQDGAWSAHLDAQIDDIVIPGQPVMLYGSRDGFTQYYSGKFPVKEYSQTINTSSTIAREACAGSVSTGSDFRKGVIYGQFKVVAQFEFC